LIVSKTVVVKRYLSYVWIPAGRITILTGQTT